MAMEEGFDLVRVLDLGPHWGDQFGKHHVETNGALPSQPWAKANHRTFCGLYHILETADVGPERGLTYATLASSMRADTDAAIHATALETLIEWTCDTRDRPAYDDDITIYKGARYSRGAARAQR
jgi:hypothetical protein